MRFLPPTEAPNPAQVRHAWDDFVERGVMDRDIVRAHVGRAWERSHAAGCSPWQARANILSHDETIALLRQETRLVEVATPFLLALSGAAGNDRHAAMLSDGEGRVLKIVGDPDTMADENFPRAGSLLSEATAGANGIGTTLAEGHYVELVGPEHYIEGFHVYTCQGVPLLGTVDTPAGVLSMSVRRVETAAKVRDILFCASEAAECELLSQSLAETLAMTAGMETMLERLRQDIVQRIAMARLQLELAARRIAAGVEPAATLLGAQELIRIFQRQAAVWRNLVGEATAAPEPILLPDLVEDLIYLLETEARVSFVKLVLRRADKIIVLHDARALTQRLLSAFLNAMQSSASHVDIEVVVGKRETLGVVGISTMSPSGTRLCFETVAPLV